MTEFFHFHKNLFAHSVMELKVMPPYYYRDIDWLICPTTHERLPEDLGFYVKKGKRWTDIIVYNESVTLQFYSQRLIELLSRFIDMDNISYPVHIEGAPFPYYLMYNLKGYPFVKQNVTKTWPFYFELSETPPALFSVMHSSFCICTRPVKEALEKAKLTNVSIESCYALTKEEHEKWKEEYGQSDING